MRFSYKNVYNSEKHREVMDNMRYVIDDKFLAETKNYELTDGFSLEVRSYEDKDKSVYTDKCILTKSGKIIYEYCCFDRHNFIFKEIIHHKNGHRYYLFKIDLYGISCLDVDTLEVYNYIPEGYEHKEEYMCGESFIITDVHYDEKSNLIAYGGCYWADISDVMAGDFSEPMNFNPHLVSLNGILDPEFDLCQDIDFMEWKNDRLYVICDDKKEESVSINQLKDMINKLTMKGKGK